MKKKLRVFLLALCLTLLVLPVPAPAAGTSGPDGKAASGSTDNRGASGSTDNRGVSGSTDSGNSTGNADGSSTGTDGGNSTGNADGSSTGNAGGSSTGTDGGTDSDAFDQETMSGAVVPPSDGTDTDNESKDPQDDALPPQQDGETPSDPPSDTDADNGDADTGTDPADDADAPQDEGDSSSTETETSEEKNKPEKDKEETDAAGETQESTEETKPRQPAAQKVATLITNRKERKTFFDEHPWVPITLKIVFIVLLTRLAAYIAARIWRSSQKNGSLLFRKFLYNIVQIIIYLIGVLCAIGQIPMLSSVVQTLLAGSGILALAISLSAQESLKSILSGLFITIFKPLEVGDRITLVNNNITGNVEDITLRHTVIKTFTNTRIIVPNATINEEIIENSNIIDSRASAFVDVWVAYESDLDLAIQIMADVIGSHPLYLDPRPEEERETTPKVNVYVRELGASGIALRSNMWTRTVDENFVACSDIRLQIKKEFDTAGIEIPYTKYTILRQEKKSIEQGRPEQAETSEQ